MWTLALRYIQGRQLLARTGKRTLVIGDVSWLNQLLQAYVSKLFALSYGIATIEVHSADPQNHLLHDFGHRVVRGTLIWLGIPDGRRSQQQQSAENAVLMTGKQANGIRNFNIGAEIIALGNNPAISRQGFSKSLVLESNNDAVYFRSINAEQREQIEQLRESCFGAMERLLASYVFFWTLAKKVAAFPCLKYEYWKSQSRTKVMTTASPVGGLDLGKLVGKSELRDRINKLNPNTLTTIQITIHTYDAPNQNYSSLAQICQQPAEFEFPRQVLPDCFHFTGSFSNPQSRESVPFPYERLTGQPLVYASLGTVQNRLLWIFEAIAEACQDLDVQLVIALGGGASSDSLPELSGKAIAVGYAPQLELLPKAALTITHAGMNTTLESLSNGVPMVAIPITNDQPGVAARIAWTGTGEVIPLEQATNRVFDVFSGFKKDAEKTKTCSTAENTGDLQPVLTMTSIGQLGRFGNQLFQYACLRICAEKSGAKVECPPWIGQTLFGHTDAPVSQRLTPAVELKDEGDNLFDVIPEFIPYLEKLADAESIRVSNEILSKGIANVDLWGFFQFHTQYFKPHREYFCSLFQPVDELQSALEAGLNTLRSQGKTIVGVHVRRGDYITESSL